MGLENIPVIGKIFSALNDHATTMHNKRIIEASKDMAMDQFYWVEDDVTTAQEVLSEAYAISARTQIENGETPTIGQRITGPELTGILKENHDLVDKLYARDMQLNDFLAYNSLQPNQVCAMLQSTLPEFSLPQDFGGQDFAND